MNTEQHLERLVMEKETMRNNIMGLLRVIGILAETHGKPAKDAMTYRLAKGKLDKFDGQVNIRTLKTGALVIEVREAEDEPS